MDEDFKDFIVKRCEKAKLEDEEYMKAERGDNDPEEVQARAEIICYLKGFSDAKYIEKYLKM